MADFFVVIIAYLGITIRAIWEIVEWFVDMLPAIRIINPLNDTISDLIVDSFASTLSRATQFLDHPQAAAKGVTRG